MQFILENQKDNIFSLARKIGYHFLRKTEKNEWEFARPPAGYPRFHLFLKQENGLIINIHLDQKKPVYKGTHAHSGEYEGEILEKETERIKKELQ